MLRLWFPFQAICHTNDTSQAARDPEEEGDFMAFEQLMAEATAKKEKETKHKHKDDKTKHSKEKEAAEKVQAEKPTTTA
jgi:hypothetical protein